LLTRCISSLSAPLCCFPCPLFGRLDCQLRKPCRSLSNFSLTACFAVVAVSSLATTMATMATRKIRVLCLDGGGIKGVTSLQMLKVIMDEIQERERITPNDSNEANTDSDNGDGAKNDEDSDGPHDEAKDASDSNPKHLKSALKPCDYFDLICGTSTGGLIALMLGRLEYVSLEYQRTGDETLIHGLERPSMMLLPSMKSSRRRSSERSCVG
jgi:hypothetical protein